MTVNGSTLTPEEAAALTVDQFDAMDLRSIPVEAWRQIRPEVKRNCADCAHFKAYVNWWCMNDDAARARGTRIPGVNKCVFWEQGERFVPPPARASRAEPSSTVLPQSSSSWFDWLMALFGGVD